MTGRAVLTDDGDAWLIEAFDEKGERVAEQRWDVRTDPEDALMLFIERELPGDDWDAEFDVPGYPDPDDFRGEEW